jgi:glycosyltransferase involved in cell wall biosynthesis
MKILHIGKYSPPFFGGIENFMMDLGQACAEQGAKVAAIVHHHQAGQSFDERQINGMTVYRVPCYGQLMFAPLSPAFGFYLNRVIDTFQPDVLHIHMPNTSAFFALLSAKARRLPWVIHWHSDVLGDESPWFLKLFYPLYRPFEFTLMKRSKKIIATSTPYLAISQALNRFKSKCKVIPLGIKVHTREQPKVQRTGGEPLRLLMVGRLTYYKGHRHLIDALGILKKGGVTDIQLHIVGTGELKSAIQKQVKTLGLSAQIAFFGKVSMSELQHQFELADCLCLPSIERTEAFGVVLMEAASYGVPSVVSDVPGSGMSWVVQDEKTGLVVKTSDAQSLADALGKLRTQPQLLNQFGAAAFERFKEHFQIHAIATRTLKLFDEVIHH